MKKKQIKGTLLLLLAAIIWGSAFVAQSVGMEYVGPFTFNCVRTLIGGIVLIPCITLLNHGKVKKKMTSSEKKRLMIGGICCGIALAIGSTLQQFGIMYTTVGKAGFITAFYIIIVPILGLLLGKKCGLSVWISVMIALIGLYFLCITDGFSIGIALGLSAPVEKSQQGIPVCLLHMVSGTPLLQVEVHVFPVDTYNSCRVARTFHASLDL